MAAVEHKQVYPVELEKLFDTIIQYEAYPKFVTGCKSVKVERKGSGKIRATYVVEMMKEVTYTVDLEENREAGTVKWVLVESALMKKNNGSWTLKTVGPGKTEVLYSVDVELNFPVPGFILNKLIKTTFPATVESFVNEAKKKK